MAIPQSNIEPGNRISKCHGTPDERIAIKHTQIPQMPAILQGYARQLATTPGPLLTAEC